MLKKRAYILDSFRTSTNLMMRRNFFHIKKIKVAKMVIWCTGSFIFAFVLHSSKLLQTKKPSVIWITSREQLEHIEILRDQTLYIMTVHDKVFHIRRNQSSFQKNPNVVREIKSSPNLLTLFSSWHESKEKILVHNNTIRNWSLLKPNVTLLVFTNDSNTGVVCHNHGLHVMPIRVANAGDVPVLKYMYLDAMINFKSYFYAFANSDILFTDGLEKTLNFLMQSSNVSNNPALIVGQRTNVNVTNIKQVSTWQDIKLMADTNGELFPVFGEDYFISTASFPWKAIEEVIIGRKGYDNYLVAYARRNNVLVIDATKTILAVHQTTSAGNFENNKQNYTEYNKILLHVAMKNITYESGYTTCAKYFTDIRENTTFLDKRNDFPKYCKI